MITYSMFQIRRTTNAKLSNDTQGNVLLKDLRKT